MAAKRSAGERVLEGKHVIGLFLLMMVFSGAFFTLGYVMGRDQGGVQAARSAGGTVSARPDSVAPKNEVAPKTAAASATDTRDTDPATSADKIPGWDFYKENESPKSQPEPHLEPVPKASVQPPASKTVAAKSINANAAGARVAPVTRTSAAPLIPNGAYILQVAALAKQDDALALASSLQKKHFSAYVQSPMKDKYYRVQVGPFKDQKTADAAKKGLEGAGFKAFYAKH